MLWYFLFLLIAPITLFAQKKQITGTVLDETGKSIPGVTVVVSGTTQGTVTNLDGKYVIDVNTGEVLWFSYIRYKTQEITVASQTVLNITLAVEAIGINEVVAIGYGTQRKGDVTSAVASVKSEDFSIGKINDAAELVKGKIAGLSITKSSGDPNATSSIMLRGITTI